MNKLELRIRRKGINRPVCKRFIESAVDSGVSLIALSTKKLDSVLSKIFVYVILEHGIATASFHLTEIHMSCAGERIFYLLKVSP